MSTPSGYVLELTPPRPEDCQYHNAYLHDVLKWKFSPSQSNAIPGFYIRNDKLVHIMRKSDVKSKITFVSNTSTTPTSGSGYVVYHNGSSSGPIRGCKEMVVPPRFRSEESEITLSDLGCKGEYTAAVDVPGSDDEPSFKVLPDSGSSTLWLLPVNFMATPELTPYQGQNIPKHNLYYPGTSAECHGTRKFDVSYLDGSFASGRVFNDDWNFPSRGGKLSTRPLFGVADSVHNRFIMSTIDGILGLGFYRGKHFSGSQPDTFLSMLRAQGLIATLMYCICFRKGKVGRSFLSLGCFPPDAPKPRRWMSVSSNAKTWVIDCYGIGWGEHPAYADFEILKLGMNVLLDSGTAYCYFPGEVLDFVRNKLGGSDMESEASDLFELPSIGFNSQNKYLWINLRGGWEYWPSASLYGDLSRPATPPNRAWYQSRLLCSGKKHKYAILGAAFFENYYVYFDADPNRPRVAIEYQR